MSTKMQREDQPMAQVKDPVCGMMVDPHTATGRSTFQGKEYVFCSASCRQKFEAHPQQYVTRST